MNAVFVCVVCVIASQSKHLLVQVCIEGIRVSCRAGVSAWRVWACCVTLVTLSVVVAIVKNALIWQSFETVSNCRLIVWYHCRWARPTHITKGCEHKLRKNLFLVEDTCTWNYPVTHAFSREPCLISVFTGKLVVLHMWVTSHKFAVTKLRVLLLGYMNFVGVRSVPIVNGILHKCVTSQIDVTKIEGFALRVRELRWRLFPFLSTSSICKLLASKEKRVHAPNDAGQLGVVTCTYSIKCCLYLNVCGICIVVTCVIRSFPTYGRN